MFCKNSINNIFLYPNEYLLFKDYDSSIPDDVLIEITIREERRKSERGNERKRKNTAENTKNKKKFK